MSRPWSIALVTLIALAAGGGTAHAQKLALGFADPVFGPGVPAAQQQDYLGRAAALGSTDLRITVSWRDVAPAVRPPGFTPANPADAAYRFGPVDVAVRRAVAARQRVLMLVAVAPDWAEQGRRPSGINPGSYRPDPAALAQFMTAVATRYGGSFDPGDGGGALPRVGAFQVWNEPNLQVYLAPQWKKVGRRQVPQSPGLYRAMVNAAYKAVKQASPQALIVEAGTAPYGDDIDGGPRMAPARFTRELLCLTGTTTRPRTKACPTPVHLDVFAHHPYGVDDPYYPADVDEDVTLADITRLARSWRLAERTRRVLPAGKRPIWVTEFGWETRPDPDGITTAKQARWLGEAVDQLTRAGVARAFWFRILDDAPVPDYPLSVQSGLFAVSGKAKPGAAMYRFPVASHGGRVSLRAPVSGTCHLQKRSGTRWVTVRSTSCRVSRRASFAYRLAKGARARVTLGDLASPTLTP